MEEAYALFSGLMSKGRFIMAMVGLVFEKGRGWVKKFAPKVLGRKGPTAPVGQHGTRTSEGRIIARQRAPRI